MREGEDTCEKCCGIEKKIHIDQHIFVNTLKTEREMRREQAGKVKSAVIIAVAVGDLAQGTGTNLTARRCIADFGTALYCSQGGGGVFTNVRAYDCTARKEGVFYSGGWGDMSVDDFVIIGAICGLETAGLEGFGGAVYAHNHTNSTRSKTTRLLNGWIAGAQQMLEGDAAIRLRGLAPTYAHNVEITNVVMDNPGQATQIGMIESGGCALNVSGSQISLTGGAESIDKARNGTGVDSYSQPTNVKYNPVRRGTVARNSVERRHV